MNRVWCCFRAEKHHMNFWKVNQPAEENGQKKKGFVLYYRGIKSKTKKKLKLL